ncbi:receptor-like protein 19 [Lolium rigidum]|uniref:receptor-like protein 19 n=1 Tax=Lolium rigidum TaxID=89674 RepID=UPI001F5CFC32|nr:receptor-like protein 19 [Lolium rigidum]
MSMLPQLQVLVLKSNQLFGNVGPSTIVKKENHCEFLKLRILSFASNNFTGTLPNKWFKSFKSMMAKSTNDTLFMQNGYRQVDQYQFTTEITYKGSVVTFSKILTTLVIIDASSNGFSGVIPRSFGELVLLCGLNLSNNAFTGMIPSQFGALHQLESLDLSSNDLSGVIPVQLAWLDFLSVFNLSYNRLVGRIPGSRHFQTFSNLSFMGNNGLCGPPLSKQCDNSASNSGLHHSDRDQVDVILFLFTGLGFGVGFAVTVVVVWEIRIRKLSKGCITSLCQSKVFCM